MSVITWLSAWPGHRTRNYNQSPWYIVLVVALLRCQYYLDLRKFYNFLKYFLSIVVILKQVQYNFNLVPWHLTSGVKMVDNFDIL